jgi:hypothetical protein
VAAAAAAAAAWDSDLLVKLTLPLQQWKGSLLRFFL